MSNFIQWPVAKYWEKTWNPMIGCHPCSPVFVKQLDIDGECVKEISRFPKHLQIRQIPWR